MRRISESVAAMALVLVLGSQAGAQMPDRDDFGAGSVPGGGSAPFNPTPGGFGLGYTQLVPSDSYVFDRYWMVVETPSAITATPDGTMTPTVANAPAVDARPRAAKVRAGKPARAARSSATRTGARKMLPVAAQLPGPLPGGSLDWPGASSVPLYSPEVRNASYGYGYDLSSYGSIDYGSSYKGYYWGY